MNPQQNWNQNGGFPSNGYPSHGYANGIPNGGFPGNFPAQPNWPAPWQNGNFQNWAPNQPWPGFNPFLQLAQLMQQCAAICAQMGSHPAIFSAPTAPANQQHPQGPWNQHPSNYNQSFNPQSNAPFPVPIDGTEKSPAKRGALSRDAA